MRSPRDICKRRSRKRSSLNWCKFPRRRGSGVCDGKTSAGRLRALMCPQRGEAAVAPAHARGDLLGCQSFSPLREDAREILVRVERRICHAQRAETRTIASAVVGDTAGSIELDCLEWPHERPAQAQSIFESLVEILRRHIAVSDEAECLRQQHGFQAVEDETACKPCCCRRHSASSETAM